MVWLASGLLLCGLTVASGSVPQVSVSLQAALFRKVIAYDDTLARAGFVDKARVLVVSQGDTRLATDLLSAFKALGVSGQEVTAADLAQENDNGAVVYLLPGEQSAQVQQLCQAKHLLSVSGDVDLVRQGMAAIGLYLDPSGRPKILINSGRLKANGHNLQASLMALAEVF